MTVRVDRIGERRLMKCGEYATIVRYGGSFDIDIKFDSGVLSFRKTYNNFKKGNINNPNFNPRLGERRLMNCGDYATIIRYKDAHNIDVMFDTGELLYNRSYNTFKDGSIAKPVSRIGERCLSNCGLYATIIDYSGCNDITIKFDSGDIIKNTYYKFTKRSFCPSWYNHRTMRACYYDSVSNDVIVLMKNGTITKKSEILGGIIDVSENR